MQPDAFDEHFKLLTGNDRFPWQRALFEEFTRRRFPGSCNIPTGLGKTSAIAIWLLALAEQARSGRIVGFPRRLIYVVNRRTVVDQATREAEQLREALATKPGLRAVADALRDLGTRTSDAPLAISTLRGQFADNAEWRNDPARPSVVVGTVDMIGSRLLFAGYGCGFKSKPLHAGFLGQDALLVHDEAHLEPAFQKLLEAIVGEQQRCHEFRGLHIMELTATSRGSGEQFRLTDADRQHAVVQRRIEAKKGIAFRPIDDEKKTPDEVAQRALEHKDSGQAILVFLRKLDHVEKVADKLRKAKLPAQILTGTLRGLERDALAKEDPIFARFMPKSKVTPQPGTVYLVCTSAGEVGVDISADHMVCDLTPFDSMAQRFGRVNRFGDGDAKIDIVHFASTKALDDASPIATDGTTVEVDANSPNDAPDETGSRNKGKPSSPFDQACALTLSLLRRLPKRQDQRHDASPAALGNLPAADRQAAFTPSPVVLSVSDILFDAWALTSIRKKMPGRPPVADWLHGVAEWEPPETHVAWREEVGCLSGDLRKRYKPEDLVEDYALEPHELLRDRTDRVFDHLELIAERCPNLSAWLVHDDGNVTVHSLTELVEKDKQRKPLVSLADCVVLLSPEAGGLTKEGMLDGGAGVVETLRYDVADEWKDEKSEPCRMRVWDGEERPAGMRRVRTIDTRPDADEEPDEGEETSRGRRYWYWYARNDGSRNARHEQDLDPHLKSAEDFASAIVAKIGLSEPEASAVTLAAKWHDLGKRREVWQRSIGNRDYPEKVLASPGAGCSPSTSTTTATSSDPSSIFRRFLNSIDSRPKYRTSSCISSPRTMAGPGRTSRRTRCWIPTSRTRPRLGPPAKYLAVLPGSNESTVAGASRTSNRWCEPPTSWRHRRTRRTHQESQPLTAQRRRRPGDEPSTRTGDPHPRRADEPGPVLRLLWPAGVGRTFLGRGRRVVRRRLVQHPVRRRILVARTAAQVQDLASGRPSGWRHC